MIWLLACTSSSPDPDDSPTLDSELSCEVDDPEASVLEIQGQAPCGRPIFETYCGGCHGDDGRGREGQTETGPDLSEHVSSHTDEELVFTIVAGQGDMPASGLPNDKVAHVLAWLRAEFGDYDGQGH